MSTDAKNIKMRAGSLAIQNVPAVVAFVVFPVRRRLCRQNPYSSTMAGSSSSTAGAAPRFPIPLSLHDLEREPYHLQPYPDQFDDDDEAARADSFAALVRSLEQGNRTLASANMTLFVDEEGDDPWMEDSRVQALYTLVRYVAWFLWSDNGRNSHHCYID